MEDSYSTSGNGCRRFKGINTSACRFAADQANALIAYEMIKAANGIGAAADTSDDRIGQSALFLLDLLLDFFRNNRLKITNDSGEWLRPHNRTKTVVRIADPGSPLTHRFGYSVL